MKKLFSLILGLSLCLGFNASADELKMGSGSKDGNYFDMAEDIFSADYCKDSIGAGNSISVLNSSGSLENLSGLLNKSFDIIMLQSDVLMAQSKKDPRNVNMNRMKIIAGLHPETIHALVPKNYKPEKTDDGNLLSRFSSMFGSKDNTPVQISLDMLKNQKIAAWGGSVVSAGALSYFFDLNWDIQTIEKEQAINSNVPLIIVGGQPYKPVIDLLASGKFVLVSLNYKEIANKAPFYMNMEATYTINGKPTSVPTIGIQALLVGKYFRNESKNEPMERLSQCINDKLSDLADDTSTNPNWNGVYELNQQGAQLNWSYFKLK